MTDHVRMAHRPPVPLDRRGFLRRAALSALAGPAALEFLAACGPDNTQPSAGLTGSGATTAGTSSTSGTASTSTARPTAGGITIATPTSPVTWPLREDNPGIADRLEPEHGATLRLYNYADYIGPAVLKAFEQKYKAYKVKVSVSTFNDTDEALTKVRANKSRFDIYFPSYDQISKMVGAKLIRPLNHSYIPNIKNVWPEFTNPWYDGGWRYTVPYTVYTTGIGWRNDKIKAAVGSLPHPLDVFWDASYAGKLAVIDDFHTAMAMVALHSGITDINTTSQADIGRIQDGLLALQKATHPKVTVTMYNDLPAGQLALSQIWSGDVVNAQYYLPKSLTPAVLSYWFPTDGTGVVDNDLMVILSQGKNPVLAHLFINFMLETKNAIDNFGFIGYQPPQVSLDPARVVSEGLVPKNLESAVVRREFFGKGHRLLELPPAADAAWHQVWQRFKAGA